MRFRTSMILVVSLCMSAAAFAEEKEKPTRDAPWTLGVVLFDGYELLDVMGPLEMFGNVGPALKIVTVCKEGGEVDAAQPVNAVASHSFENCPPLDIVLVPGGAGTNEFIDDEESMEWLQAVAGDAQVVASVCTGADILGAAGLLDGYKATTNKLAFNRVSKRHDQVEWIPEARWVEDRDRYTSSGVSAGIDLSLRMIEIYYGTRTAERVALGAEYIWNRDPSVDPFARE